ncbi:hypothetical protein AAG570_005380 [Ranatra chinensis]|uniref:Uncharacterized protein n=1 Tax=Ranatra chinensis TaxID=642074 RepID=A0ABD0Y0B6_9HEMI
MVLKNLQEFQIALGGCYGGLFEVYPIKVRGSLILDPSPQRIYSYIGYAIEDLFKRFRTIPRWLRGSCCRAPTVRKVADGREHTYNYLDQLLTVKCFYYHLNRLNNFSMMICWGVKAYLNWDEYRHLWQFDKFATVKQFMGTDPTIEQIDSALGFYTDIWRHLDNTDEGFVMYSIRVSLFAIREMLKSEAMEWKRTIGLAILGMVRGVMATVEYKIEVSTLCQTSCSTLRCPVC